MGYLAAMLRRIRCSALLAEQRTGCHLNAGSLRSLANVALHARRCLRGLQETLTLDHGQITGADSVDIDDERTSQLGLMSLKERLHAGILSKLGTQGHEPHLGIDVRVAELVHLIELLVKLNGRGHSRRSRFIGKLLGGQVAVLHATRGVSAAMPRAEAVGPGLLVVCHVVDVERIVVSDLGSLLACRLNIDRLGRPSLGCAKVVALQSGQSLRGPGIRCRILIGLDGVIALILALLVVLFLEALPAAARLSGGTGLEVIIHVEPLLRRVLFVILAMKELVEQAAEARFRHLHVARARKCTRFGEVIVVSGIIRIIDVHVLGIHSAGKLAAHRSKRAGSTSGAEACGSAHARLGLSRIRRLDGTGQRRQGREQGRPGILLLARRLSLFILLLMSGLDIGRPDGGKQVQQTACRGLAGGFDVGKRSALLHSRRNGGRRGGRGDFRQGDGSRGNHGSVRDVKRLSLQFRHRLIRRFGHRCGRRHRRSVCRIDTAGLVDGSLRHIDAIARAGSVGLAGLGLFLHLSRIQERRHGNVAHRGNVLEMELRHIDRGRSRRGEGVGNLCRSDNLGLSRFRCGNLRGGELHDRLLSGHLLSRGLGHRSGRLGGEDCNGSIGLRRRNRGLVSGSRFERLLELCGLCYLLRHRCLDCRLLLHGGLLHLRSLLNRRRRIHGGFGVCGVHNRLLGFRLHHGLHGRNGCPLRSANLANGIAIDIEGALKLMLHNVVRLREMTGAFGDRGIKGASVTGTLRRLLGVTGLLGLFLSASIPIRHACLRRALLLRSRLHLLDSSLLGRCLLGLELGLLHCCLLGLKLSLGLFGLLCLLGLKSLLLLLLGRKTSLLGIATGALDGARLHALHSSFLFSFLSIVSLDLLKVALNLFGGHTVDGLAGQCRDCSLGGDEALLIFHGGTGMGRIHELGAFGHKTALIRGLRSMHQGVLALSNLGFAHTARTDAASQLEQSSNAGSVAIRTFVVGCGLMQCAKSQRDSGEQHGDNGQQREDSGERTFGRPQRNALDEQQHGKGNHCTEGDLADKRHDLRRGTGKLGTNLAGVVTSHQDHLSASSSFAILRRCGGILRHNVLAHAFP